MGRSPRQITSSAVPSLASLSLSCLESHVRTLLASVASLQEQYQRQGQEKSVMCGSLEKEIQAALSLAQITQYHWVSSTMDTTSLRSACMLWQIMRIPRYNSHGIADDWHALSLMAHHSLAWFRTA